MGAMLKNHPILEVVSWIAGIFALPTMIAIAIWLPVKSPETNKEPPTQAPTATPPSRTVSDAPAAPPATTTTKRDSEGATWSCDGVAQDLKPALAAAKALSSQVEGDRALAAVARKGLCIYDFAVFDQAAVAVRSQTMSDRVYFDAVRTTVEQRSFDLARNYADKIRSSVERDKAIKLIVEIASVQTKS